MARDLIDLFGFKMFAGCFPLPLPAESGGDPEAPDPELIADFKTGGEDSLGVARLYGGLGMFSGLSACIWKQMVSRSCFSVQNERVW